MPVKKQLHVFRLQPLPDGETTFQKHELIYLQSLTPKQRQALKFIFFALPPAGIELNLEVTNSQSVQMKLEDHTWGLPAISGKEIAPRPADLMPVPGHPDYSNVSIAITYLSELESSLHSIFIMQGDSPKEQVSRHKCRLMGERNWVRSQIIEIDCQGW